MPNPFLSDEWIAEVEQLRDGTAGLMMPPGMGDLTVNLVVNGGPDGRDQFHLTGAPGGLAVRAGHVDAAPATVILSYDLARAMFVDQNQQAVMTGWTSGQMKIEGDMTKLMALAQGMASQTPAQQELNKKIQEATA